MHTPEEPMHLDHPAAARAREVVEEFELFDDWTGRYEHLIEQARSLEPLDDAFRTDAFRVQGCQSQVWLSASFDGERMHFRADSDAIITRGLVALLVRVFNDMPPDDVVSADVDWMEEIGMQEHLSTTRKNGLEAMIRRMKLLAAAHTQTSPSRA